MSYEQFNQQLLDITNYVEHGKNLKKKRVLRQTQVLLGVEGRNNGLTKKKEEK